MEPELDFFELELPEPPELLELPEDETVPVPVPAVPALAPVVPLFP